MSTSEIVLPDETKLYAFERAKGVFEAIQSRKYTVADAVLLLLYAQKDRPIYGRTSLMKQVFLLIHEVLGERQVQPARYVPQRFGMYSHLVTNTVANQELARLVVREGKKNTKAESFRISKKGEEYIASMFQSLPPDLQQTLMERRKGWDQWGREGILQYVYQQYPAYRDTSVLKNRYAPIIWGKGKG
jgi:uncharacterized protein YwgA